MTPRRPLVAATTGDLIAAFVSAPLAGPGDSMAAVMARFLIGAADQFPRRQGLEILGRARSSAGHWRRLSRGGAKLGVVFAREV